MNDEYLEIWDRYPGEFALMANAHALEEGCRPIVDSEGFDYWKLSG